MTTAHADTATGTRPPSRDDRPVDAGAGTGRAVLDIVVPVFNEESDLESSVRRLHAFLRGSFPYTFRITIADNASTDTTPAIARRLAGEIAEVRTVRLEQKGRGRERARHSDALAGRVPALDRWFGRQHPVGPGLRLQRPGSDFRQRGWRDARRWDARRRRGRGGRRRGRADGRRSRRRGHGVGVRRRDRHPADVRLRVRHPGVLAAPGGAAAARRGAGAARPGGPDRPGAGVAGAVVRLDAGHHAGPELHGRDRAPVLRRGPGPGDRGTGRDRRPRGPGAPRPVVRPRRARRRDGRHRGLVVRAARLVHRLPALAAVGGAGARRARRGGAVAAARSAARAVGGGRDGDPGRGRGTRGVRGADGRDPAVRVDPDGRARGGRRSERARRRPRRWWSRRQYRGDTGGSAASSPDGGGSGDGGPGGGGPDGEQVDTQVAKLLRTAGTARWAAATIGSQSAASLMLAAGDDTAVLGIGGWSGSDEYPTLEQFQQYVQQGEIRYLVAGGGAGGPGGDRGTGAQITEWVAAHYTATTVGGTTVYDLAAPAR